MTTPTPSWGRIPAELRNLSQWAVAGANKAPMAVGQDGALFNVKVTDPKHWMDFNTACQLAWDNRELVTEHVVKGTGEVVRKVGLDIGFILHENDPFTCIDLDVKDATNEPDSAKWTTQAQFNLYWDIMRQFDSYTETSRSGKGVHIWALGKIGKGARRDGVELYSQERFIITTGNIIYDKPVQERQNLLDGMLSQMRAVGGNLAELTEEEEELSDEDIIDRAMHASNSVKFNDLCAGNWQKYDYPSQSEADLALMSIFAFYSKSNEQCRRLFRMSVLGQREKATKNNRHLDYTLRLIRSRQQREQNVELEGERIAARLIERMNNEHQTRANTPLHVATGVETVQHIAPPAAAVTLAAPVTAPLPHEDGGLPWPPGMAGAIAGFIFNSAYRPVKEVAVVATLGFLAGICGKAFSIPQSGLNIYMILVAQSAIGKEAMHSGISALCQAAYQKCPSIMEFVNFTDFASGPALQKAVVGQQSMINVAGEWGRKLKRMAQEDGRDGPLSSLRTVMTNLYQKSGPQAIVGGITYSNSDSNVASVSGVSYSMIGETTPGTFYESLTETMMEDGFLSRFNIVEYVGDRPPPNPNPVTVPPQSLSDAVADLAQQARHLIGINQHTPVGRDAESARMFHEFEMECDREINSTNDESWRQMWNRAALKVMRISALLAVADNWFHPAIRANHVEWALELVRRDIAVMQRRIESGDVGVGDQSRERKLLAVCAEYIKKAPSKSYDIPKGMHENGIVPRKYLLTRCARATAFSGHRMGSSVALDATIRSLCDSGFIMEVDKAKLVELYSFHGRCFRILDLPNYSGERTASKGR